MIPKKRVSRRFFALVLLGMGWCGLLAHAATDPVDPFVGDWLYLKDCPVKFTPDGKAIWTGKGAKLGTWEYLHNPEVERHYRIVWENGKAIDTVVLTENGQLGHVTNKTGKNHYDIHRALLGKPGATGKSSTYFGASSR